jgi:hypothetical protein
MNLKKAVTGETINWFKVKWIQVTKDCPASIFFNYNFDQENFMARLNKMHDSGYLKACFVYFHTTISQMVFLLRETMFNFD